MPASGDRSGQGKVHLGIVGCGAITEQAHLPAALSSSAVELAALADTNELRLRYLQRRFSLGPIFFNDYRQLFGRVDAVILAVPNALHAPIAVEFLSRGIHVLCEKPLAVTRRECEQLCQAAQATCSLLAVGYWTRFYPSTELTKQLIESRFLGVLQSFDYEFGTVGGWASVSGYNLARSMSGGGVLVVSGSHFIDRMLYFFDEVEVISYADDSRGGLEANCVARFRACVKGEQLEGHITLSKTHWLANRLRIIGEKGALEVGEGQSRSVNYLPARSPLQHAITYSAIANIEVEEDYFLRQLDDFVRAIKTGTPRVDGEQASKSVALMERCYEIAQPLQEPWCDATLERLKAVLPEPATALASLQPSLSERP